MWENQDLRNQYTWNTCLHDHAGEPNSFAWNRFWLIGEQGRDRSDFADALIDFDLHLSKMPYGSFS